MILGVPVYRLAHEMPASELAAWRTFFNVEGTPERRADLRAAVGWWLLASTFAGRRRPPRLEELVLPDPWEGSASETGGRGPVDPEERRRSQEALAAAMRAFLPEAKR